MGNSQGVSCPSNSSLPIIDTGFFRDDIDFAKAALCSPKKSCEFTGSNLKTTCKLGYTGNFCRYCVYLVTYRHGACCRDCPGSAERILTFFMLALIVLFVIWRLSRSENDGRIPLELKLLFSSLQLFSFYSDFSQIGQLYSPNCLTF